MKKILTLFLMINCLLAPLAANAIDNPEAAAENSASMQYAKKAFDVMDALGIVSDYEDNTFIFEEEITRAEFIMLAVKSLGLGVIEPIKTDFFDLSYNHWSSGYVGAAAGFGLIAKSDYFYPENTITLNEALKISICMLGRNEIAYQQGGYPAGYLSQASQLKLLKNIELKEKITRLDAIILLLNTLDAIPAEIKSFQADNRNYNLSGEQSLMEIIFDTSKRTGIMESTDSMSVWGKPTAATAQIMIDSKAIDVPQKDYSIYLGKAVEYYIKTDADQAYLIYIEEKLNYNTTIKVTYDKILKNHANFSASRFVYQNENGKEISLNIKQPANILVNGRYYTPPLTSDMLSPAYGSVELIDNNKDDIYEYIFVMDEKPFIVESVNAIEDTISEKNTQRKIDLSDDRIKYLKITRNGELCEPKNLRSWDILLIKTSGDYEYVEITAAANVIKGTASEIDTDNGTITIDNTSYTISPFCNTQNIKLGLSLSYHLDSNGNIAWVEQYIPKGNEYLYLFKAKTNEFNTTLYIEVINSAGIRETMSIDNNIMLNGNVSASPRTMYNYLSNNTDEIAQQLLSVSYNEKGNIIALYTVDATDYLRLTNPQETKTYAATQKIMGLYEQNGFFLSSDSVIFYIDKNEIDDSSVKQITGLTDKTEYKISAYNTDEGLTAACAVIDVTNSASSALFINYKTNIGIIDSFYDTVLPDLTQATGINLYSAGAKTKLICDQKIRVTKGGTTDESQVQIDFKNLGKGDIIYYSVNSKGYVDMICKLFPITSTLPALQSEKEWIRTGSHGYSTERGFGTVIMKYGEICKVRFNLSPDPFTYTYLISGASIVVYDVTDANNTKIRIGSTDDLEVGDRILLRANTGAVGDIFIIKNND